MTGEEGWTAAAVAAAAVGVIVGARMADRRRRLRMARHELWRRTALEEARSRLEREDAKRRSRRVWRVTSVPGARLPHVRAGRRQRERHTRR